MAGFYRRKEKPGEGKNPGAGEVQGMTWICHSE